MWGGEIPRLRSEWHWGERRKDGSPHARGQGGSFHPHPNLSPLKGEGRGRRAPTRGAPTGEGGVRWAVGMAHSNGMEGRWACGGVGATRLFARLRSEWHLGERRKDGSPHARGQGGSFHPHPNFPPSRGKGGEGGRPRGAPLRGKGEWGGRG